jgi:hypothetical protein
LRKKVKPKLIVADGNAQVGIAIAGGRIRGPFAGNVAAERAGGRQGVDGAIA